MKLRTVISLVVIESLTASLKALILLAVDPSTDSIAVLN